VSTKGFSADLSPTSTLSASWHDHRLWEGRGYGTKPLHGGVEGCHLVGNPIRRRDDSQEHENPGEATLQVLGGRVRLVAVAKLP
jgi:hypothetical protein